MKKGGMVFVAAVAAALGLGGAAASKDAGGVLHGRGKIKSRRPGLQFRARADDGVCPSVYGAWLVRRGHGARKKRERIRRYAGCN